MFTKQEIIIIENLSDRFSNISKSESEKEISIKDDNKSKEIDYWDVGGWTRDSFKSGKGVVRNGLFTITIGTDKQPVFSRHIDGYDGVASAYLPIAQFYYMFKLRPTVDDPKYVDLANKTVGSTILNNDLRYLSTSLELLNRYRESYEKQYKLKDTTLEDQQKYINDYIYPCINRDVFKKSDPEYNFVVDMDGFKLITESHCDAYFIALLCVIYAFNNRVGEETGIDDKMNMIPTKYILSKHGKFKQSFDDFYKKAIEQAHSFVVERWEIEGDAEIAYMNGCFFGDSFGDIHYFYYDTSANDRFTVITFANVAEKAKIKDFIDACSSIVGMKFQHGYGGERYFKDFLIGLNSQGKDRFLDRLGKLCQFAIYGIKADKVLNSKKDYFDVDTVFKTYNVADWAIEKYPKSTKTRIHSITTGLSAIDTKNVYGVLMLSVMCPIFHEKTRITSTRTFDLEINYKYKDDLFSIGGGNGKDQYIFKPILDSMNDYDELVSFFKDSKKIFKDFYPLIKAKVLSDKALKYKHIFLYSTGEYKQSFNNMFIAYGQEEVLIDNYTERPIISIVKGTGVEPLDSKQYYIMIQTLNFPTIIEDDLKNEEDRILGVFNKNADTNIRTFSELKEMLLEQGVDINNLATPFPFKYTKKDVETVFHALSVLMNSKNERVTKRDFLRYVNKEIFDGFAPKDAIQMVEKAKKYLKN